ncbi:N-acetylmuramoyl-L-alanine amidase [Brotaphodocola sp.]|uniref:N-acetylmuramoyl-L-alanine amidase n=1 Tax=Brotaphodocola sp. TaxID=3073577 RepID=UPI003D7D8538
MRKRVICTAAVLATAMLAGGCQKKESAAPVSSPVAAEQSLAQDAASAFASEENSTLLQTVSTQTQKSAHETDKSMMPMETRNETVYVNTDQVNVRRAPGTDAKVAGRVNRGEQLTRTGYSEGWSQVMYNNEVCYISSTCLSTEKVEAAKTAAAASTSTSSSQTVADNAVLISLNPQWTYAGFAKIASGSALLYQSTSVSRNGKVVCVNAGHGTKGGSSVKTQCHPDGTPKVTGGTTGAGATSAVAVSGGTTFQDGTPEAKVTLQAAQKLRDKLLERGYDVLMIRDGDDVQLDNIARTVIANNMADCHIALHWDSTKNDKGAFYMSVPDVASYRAMEPVASNWQRHHALGDSLISGLRGAGVKIFSSGTMAMDLTQTSYSMIPSVDIELGDTASDHSASTLNTLAEGLASGVDQFFAR